MYAVLSGDPDLVSTGPLAHDLWLSATRPYSTWSVERSSVSRATAACDRRDRPTAGRAFGSRVQPVRQVVHPLDRLRVHDPRASRSRGGGFKGSSPGGSSTPARRARRSRPPFGSGGWSFHARSSTRAHEKVLVVRGTARIEQQALGDFIDAESSTGTCAGCGAATATARRRRRGARRVGPGGCRAGHRRGSARRDSLPGGDDEAAILKEGRRRGILFHSLRPYVFGAGVHPPTILLGYAPASEATIRAGIASSGR
jgi:hypothetical protein